MSPVFQVGGDVPEHGGVTATEGFECEEAVAGTHPWPVEAHQTVELLKRHPVGPLQRRAINLH